MSSRTHHVGAAAVTSTVLNRDMGNRIKALREAKKWSQERLAEEIGTTRQQISRLEKGKRRLSELWMRPLMKVLSATAADILGDANLTIPMDIAYFVSEHGAYEGVQSSRFAGHSVERPPEMPEDGCELEAAAIDSDLLAPAYNRGDVIYSRANPDPDWRAHVGKRCVVKVEGNAPVIRTIRLGADGSCTLVLVNGVLVENQPIEWAKRIEFIKFA